MNDTLGLCEEKNSGVACGTIFMQTRFKEVWDIPPVSPDGAVGKQICNVTESKTSPSTEQVSGSLMSKAL